MSVSAFYIHVAITTCKDILVPPKQTIWLLFCRISRQPFESCHFHFVLNLTYQIYGNHFLIFFLFCLCPAPAGVKAEREFFCCTAERWGHFAFPRGRPRLLEPWKKAQMRRWGLNIHTLAEVTLRRLYTQNTRRPAALDFSTASRMLPLIPLF